MSFFKLRGLFSRKIFLNINAIIMQYPCLHKAQQYTTIWLLGRKII